MFSNGNQPPFLFEEGEVVLRPKTNNRIRFLRATGNWSELALATTASELFALAARICPPMQPAYWIVSSGITVVLVVRFAASQGKEQARLSRLIVGVLVGGILGWADAVGQLVAYYWEEFLAVVAVALAVLILVVGTALARYRHRKQQKNIFGGYQ